MSKPKWCDFARQLERELEAVRAERDEALAANQRANALIGSQADENAKIITTLQREVEELRNELKQSRKTILALHDSQMPSED